MALYKEVTHGTMDDDVGTVQMMTWHYTDDDMALWMMTWHCTGRMTWHCTDDDMALMGTMMWHWAG
jgi:hypothetical protein